MSEKLIMDIITGALLLSALVMTRMVILKIGRDWFRGE